MLKTQRQKNLMDLLVTNEVMSVSDLSEKLNTSMMTIRRDLDYLEQKGIIRKVHGGAVLVKSESAQPTFHERIDEFADLKQSIGREVAKLIKEGSIVFFDAGTTPLAVVDYIPDDLEFTAITTGLITAVALCNKPKVNVINIGGNIHGSSYSSTNHLAVEMIKNFNADMAFISTKAFSLQQGSFESLLPLIEVKKSMVSVSRKVVLLADRSKFETKSLCLSIPIENIDLIITDSSTPANLIDGIKEIGKEVIIA